MSAAAPDANDADAVEALEIELLLTAVHRRYGYDFRGYAPASLGRRIRKIVEQEGLPSVSALQERILRDADVLARFVATISVHVTAMFRDPPFYKALREQVVPILRTWPFTRAWVAGCSTGEEAYSLAILLHEEGLYDRCRIYATDVSDDLVRRARRGIFPAPAMQTYTANYRQSGGTEDFARYYHAGPGGDVIVRDFLRERVVFSHHNLVSDHSFNEFHLILCRNVMIYFDDALKARVHRLLYESLPHFGVLGLGPREHIDYTPHAADYDVIGADERLYRKAR